LTSPASWALQRLAPPALDQLQRPGAGRRLDAADAGGDAGLLDDLEQADVAGGPDVGAAAQLHAEVADLHHPHLFAVLLAEQGGGAGGTGLLGRHLPGFDLLIVADAAVDFNLDPASSSVLTGEKWVKSKRRRSG
jgi:hypothetical protein